MVFSRGGVVRAVVLLRLQSLNGVEHGLAAY